MHSIMPYVTGEISAALKKLVKSSTEYEFDLSPIVDDYKALAFEEAKVISLKGVMWQQLGKDAFTEWYRYFHSKNSTTNSITLILRMFKRLMENTCGNIERAEQEQEKKKPKQAKPSLAQKREVAAAITGSNLKPTLRGRQSRRQNCRS